VECGEDQEQKVNVYGYKMKHPLISLAVAVLSVLVPLPFATIKALRPAFPDAKYPLEQDCGGSRAGARSGQFST
jgi:hypothetical protein